MAQAFKKEGLPEEQRGLVSGVLGMCPSVAAVAGTFLAQALVGSVFWMFMAPAVVALVTVLILVFVLHDRTIAGDQQLAPYGIGEFLRSFWVNPLRYPDFGWNQSGFLRSLLSTLTWL